LIAVLVSCRSLIREKGVPGMAREDHVVPVDVDGSAKGGGAAEKPSEAVSSPVAAVALAPTTAAEPAEGGGGEDEPLIQAAAECRICQEEDTIKNLEKPCACNGSLKVAI
jgi:hypothetical protein